MILWLNVVPGYAEAANSWPGWAREAGLANWGPFNLGGLLGSLAGGWLGARRAGETQALRLALLAGAVIVTWFVVNVWLFNGLEIELWLRPGDPTGG